MHYLKKNKLLVRLKEVKKKNGKFSNIRQLELAIFCFLHQKCAKRFKKLAYFFFKNTLLVWRKNNFSVLCLTGNFSDLLYYKKNMLLVQWKDVYKKTLFPIFQYYAIWKACIIYFDKHAFGVVERRFLKKHFKNFPVIGPNGNFSDFCFLH